MSELIFRLRVVHYQTVVKDDFFTEALYEVDCLSFKSFANRTVTERFDGGQAQVQEELEKRGWEKAGGWDNFVLKIPLPISGHELAELPKGMLSRYWVPECLLDLFQQANAEKN